MSEVFVGVCGFWNDGVDVGRASVVGRRRREGYDARECGVCVGDCVYGDVLN